jgi:ubiquinone/menaquinone biosynthesis C-methylase UbiE
MPPPLPHFIRDYRVLTANLMANHSLPEAMALAVGGDYEAAGANTARELIENGLLHGHFLIDLGCGSGRLSTQLSKMFGTEINYLGVDVVPELLAYARQKAVPEYEFKLTDGQTIPSADAAADFICAISLFTHLRRTETNIYFREIARVLKPGGTFLFSFLELPAHTRLFLATITARFRGMSFPENHFLSRRVIGKLSENHGFSVGRFIPKRQSRPFLSRYYAQSIAVLRRN